MAHIRLGNLLTVGAFITEKQESQFADINRNMTITQLFLWLQYPRLW